MKIKLQYLDKKDDKIEEVKENKAVKVKTGSKRKASKDEPLAQPIRKKPKVATYELPKDVQSLIDDDVGNSKIWATIKDSLKLGYPVSLLFCKKLMQVVNESSMLPGFHQNCC